MLLPVRINVLAVLVPEAVKEPLPEITLGTVYVPLRLNTSEVESTTGPEPNVPLVDPLPICNVPPLIVVVPLYVLAPVSTTVPAKVFVKLPFPEITPATERVAPAPTCHS